MTKHGIKTIHVVFAFSTIFVFGICTLLNCNTNIKTTQCTVLSHSTTSNQYGEIQYYTEMTCNDNKYRSLDGLSYYTQPIGTVVPYNYRVIECLSK